MSADGIECRHCGKELKVDANFCEACGGSCGDVSRPRRRPRSRMSSTHRLRLQDAVSENDELHSRIQELERINRMLVEECQQQQASGSPVVRRLTATAALAWPRRSRVLEDDSASDVGSVPGTGQARRLWEKALHHARITVRIRKAMRLQLQLVVSASRCDSLAAEVAELTSQLHALVLQSRVQEAALAARDESMREMRLMHQQEKQRLFDTIQQLEEQVSFVGGKDDIKGNLLSEELADAMRNTASRGTQLELGNNAGMEELMAAWQVPDDGAGGQPKLGELWSTIVELQRQLVIAKKDAKDKASRPFWSHFTSTFCASSREGRPVRMPAPANDDGESPASDDGAANYGVGWWHNAAGGTAQGAAGPPGDLIAPR